jgi:hypothetical protein
MLNITVTLRVRNGAAERLTPPHVAFHITIESGLYDASIYADAVDPIDAPLFGVPRGVNPSVMASPRITEASLFQENPVAGALNNLTLTVRFSTHVPVGSDLNITGLRALADQYFVSSIELFQVRKTKTKFRV